MRSLTFFRPLIALLCRRHGMVLCRCNYDQRSVDRLLFWASGMCSSLVEASWI